MDERVLEIAEALTAALAENEVAKIRAKVQKRDPSFDGICVECDEPIPDARLDTGATTCLECQQFLELRQAQYRL